MHRDHSDIGLNTATFGAFTATAPATGLARGELASRPSLPLRTFATRGRNEAASGIPGDIDSPYELAFLRGGASEVLRLHLFDLVERGYLEVIETRKWLSTTLQLAQAQNPPPYEDLTGAAKVLVQPSGNDGLIFAHAVSGFAFMVHRKGFAMVALK